MSEYVAAPKDATLSLRVRSKGWEEQACASIENTLEDKIRLLSDTQ